MTKDQLKKIMPYATSSNIDLYLPYLNQYMHEYGICGWLRESAFLATIIHESGSIHYVQEIASGQAYEGRKDLGNTQKGDGVRFKGRGLIQLTGRANYQKASEALGVDFVSNPALIEQPKYAVMVSCWWWKQHGCNELADTKDIEAVTRRVNGGLNGIADRKKWYNLALEVLK